MAMKARGFSLDAKAHEPEKIRARDLVLLLVLPVYSALVILMVG